MEQFFDPPFFEAPSPSDVSRALAPGDEGEVDGSCQGALVRVLLREGLASGSLELSTEQSLSGSEAYTAVALASTSAPYWTLKWFVVRGGFGWAREWSAWPWNSLENVFSPWPEFLGVKRLGRAAIVENIENSWERSAVNAGLGDVRSLGLCDFRNLDDHGLNDYLASLSDAIENEDEDILWGEFFDERFLDMESGEERVEAARAILHDVSRQLRQGSYEDLLSLSPVWGSDDELNAAVEWTYDCSGGSKDAMDWARLPWDRQRELLSHSSVWVKGVAVALPSARPELRDWLAKADDRFIRYALG